MPGGDGTGPAGMGPMTGRAAGYCAGFAGPGYMQGAGGRGFWGWGRGGGGRGWRNWFRATGLTRWQRAGMGWAAGPAVPFTPAGAEQQVEALRAQAEHFEGILESIRQRIEKLELERKE